MKIDLYNSRGTGILNATSSIPKWIGTLLLIGIGIILIVVGVFATKSEIEKKATYVVTEAEVISIDEKTRTVTDSDGYTRREYEYAPEIEYYYNGDRYTKRLSYSSTMPSIGAFENVYVNPNNPKDILTSSTTSPTFIVIGVVLVLAGIVSGIIGLIKKAVNPA